MEQQSKMFKSCLLVIATGLNQKNVQDIVFLHKEKINTQSTCLLNCMFRQVTSCQHHGGLNGVVVMDTLLEKGVFSKYKTEPLTAMLEEIGRMDLANDFAETFDKTNLALQSPVDTTYKNSPSHDGKETEPLIDNPLLAPESPPLLAPELPPLLAPESPLASQKTCDIDRKYTRMLNPGDDQPELTDTAAGKRLSEGDISVFSSGQDETADEYVVLLNSGEIKEAQKLLKNHPSKTSGNKKSLQRKIETLALKAQVEPDSPEADDDYLEDAYEIINPEDAPTHHQSLNDQYQRRQRVFSVDHLKSVVPKLFKNCASSPDMSLPRSVGARSRGSHCCDGACVHTDSDRWHKGRALLPSEFRDSRERSMELGEDSGRDSYASSQSSSSTNLDLVASQLYNHQQVIDSADDIKDGSKIIHWSVSRDRFSKPIFHHKNKHLEKKVHLSIGCHSSHFSINLSLKLYPNGIGKDCGSSSTLTVDTLGMSPQRSTMTLHYTFKGFDDKSNKMVVSRSSQIPLTGGLLTLEEFLSHEEIQTSYAKHFLFVLIFQFKEPRKTEWVILDDPLPNQLPVDIPQPK